MLRMAARPPSSGVVRAGRIPGDPSIPHPTLVAGLTLVAVVWAAAPALAQEVVGRVAAESSGEAIVGAFVRLVPEDGGRPTAALTGRDGRYRIEVATPGRYRIARTSRQLDRRTLEPTISYRADWLWQRMGAPWEFAPPDQLLREGFALRYFDGTVQLLVPGPDIFLEDTFLASHCFHVSTADPPAPGLIGLAFEPMGDDDAARIAGVLWLDRDRLVLHSLDFLYIIPWRNSPIPSAQGSLQFAYLASGLWIIRDWTLRMPVRLKSRSRGNGDLIVEDGAHVVFALDEVGEVIWADSALAAELGRDGEFDGMATTIEPTSSIFTIESPAALAAQGCGVRGVGDETVDAVGFVGDLDGNPLPNTRVLVRWDDGRRVRETEVRTTFAGLFTVCAIPTDTEIEIEATRSGFVPWVERGRTQAGRLFTAELLLRPATR